ncbi:MAG: hypothetical protein H6701_06785 [Myxococcales bacterium]|nr:hypothetical protein [Myxococcales bacterium]
MHTGSRAVLILATALLAATPAAADEAPAWAASRVSLLNTFNTYELDKSHSLTWNPYYAVGVRVSPAWRLTEDLSLGAGIALLREVTQSDITTEEGEWWFDDLTVSAGHRGIELPVIGTRLGGSLALFFPTSKASQARSMQWAIRPGLSLTQSFPVLAGLSLRYAGSMRYIDYEYTTSGYEEPTNPCDRGIECAALRGSGLRNVRWMHTHSLGFALGVFDWLSLSASASVNVSALHDLIEVETNAPDAVPSEHHRYLMGYDAELTLGPWYGLSTGLGISTYNPQRAPDQTFYDPFYNRYTQAYLDLRIDIAGLIARREEK